MNNIVRTFVVVAVLVGVGVLSYFLFGFSAKAAPAPSVSDITVGEVVAYHDFHTCRQPDGELSYDVHFGGKDRSRRAQFVDRLNNLGERTLQVLTTDRTLPKGHVRLVVEVKLAKNREGHNFGTEWSGEILQINPRRPIEHARTIPSCGPERH